MVNYSKWDTIEDEDEAVAVDRTADFVKRAEHHKASMQLIATQLRQAWPTLSGEQTAHLLDFVQAQHRGVFADNTKRATEIVAFIEGALCTFDQAAARPRAVRATGRGRGCRRAVAGAGEAGLRRRRVCAQHRRCVCRRRRRPPPV